MSDYISSNKRQEFCKKMSLNLATLRTKANIKQDELADKLGLSRQTISAIENRKRDMQWSTFTLLALFFSGDREIKELMAVMGIIDESVDELLNINKKNCDDGF